MADEPLTVVLAGNSSGQVESGEGTRIWGARGSKME